jgi:hypothetical protein
MPTYIVIVFMMFATASGCASQGRNTSFASYGVSTQREAAALVTKWREEARARWQQADALEREAALLGEGDGARNSAEIEQRRLLAQQLRASGDELAQQATDLQRQLPVRMIQ